MKNGKKFMKRVGKGMGIGLSDKEKIDRRRKALERLEYEKQVAQEQAAIRKARQQHQPKPTMSSFKGASGGNDFFSMSGSSGSSYFGGSYFDTPKAKPKKRKRKKSKQKIRIYR
jgi:hypothetical protein